MTLRRVGIDFSIFGLHQRIKQVKPILMVQDRRVAVGCSVISLKNNRSFQGRQDIGLSSCLMNTAEEK